MDCARYRELVVADLDGVLPVAEASAAAMHLAGCAACRDARALEAEFGTLLRQASRIVATPAPVKERVLAALAGASPAARRPALLHRASVVAVALAAIALLLAVMRPREARWMGSVHEDYRLAAAAHLSLQVRTDDPRTLERYFDDSGRFDFPAQVMDLRSAGYQLLGGAVREDGGLTFAVSVYAGQGDIVVCHRFRAPQAERSAEGRAYVRRAGLWVRVARAGGVICCLSTRMEPDEFERRVVARL